MIIASLNSFERSHVDARPIQDNHRNPVLTCTQVHPTSERCINWRLTQQIRAWGHTELLDGIVDVLAKHRALVLRMSFRGSLNEEIEDLEASVEDMRPTAGQYDAAELDSPSLTTGSS
jgi:hypothetical protein